MRVETNEWLRQSEYDLDTAESMYAAGRYIYTIFMCHLAVEKALKSLIVEQTGKVPPKIHNLVRLMKQGNAKLTYEQVKYVTRLSLAGIVTRYPEDLRRAIDDYPRSVTRDYLDHAKDVVRCLKQQIK